MTFPASAPILTDISRILALYAHPDDVEFSSAGTVAGWVAEGHEVAYLLVTRGDAGGFDDTPRNRVPGIREREQRAAASAVGVQRVDFLEGYSDGTVAPTLALRRDITATIRRFRPDRILPNAPLRRWERISGPSHPDHLAVGEAVTCAIYPDSRNPFAFPELLAEGLEPGVVRELWFSGGPSPDHAIDVTDRFDQKMAALRAHESQVAHLPDLEKLIRDRLTAVAQGSGLPDGRLAEAFTFLRTE